MEKSETKNNSDNSLEINIEENSEIESLLEGKRKKWLKPLIISLLGISMALFHMYTAYFGILENWQQRSMTVIFLLLLIPFVYPFKHGSLTLKRLVDGLYLMTAVALSLYIWLGYPDIIIREGQPNTLDLIFGTLVCVLILEATRRTVGNAMTILILIFILYLFFGNQISGRLGHPGFSYSKIINTFFNTTSGIFGIIMGAMSTFIVVFIVFGSFLAKSKAGRFFIEIAYGLTGAQSGGPAKVAVIASGAMGTISGVAVSNVVTTGALTIPLMKRVGYKPHFAGAVEASASAGGQLMPPIMGAAAFLIATNLQMPYAQVMLAALFPALLHYFAIYMMVHLEAKKNNLKGLPKSELPNVKKVFKEGWFLLLPVITIITLLISGYSPQKAGFVGILSIVLVSYFRKGTRMNWKQILGALEIGAKNSIQVAAVCGSAGILVGIITLTGLGLKFSSLVVNSTGGILIIALFFTMLASIILGMGMPTISAYVILAVLGVPALINLGVEPIAAQLFVFYFAIMSNVTPPVAIAAYAAAAIANANANQTGFTALKLCLGSFIVPYMFVFGPPLLMQGEISEIILAVISAVIGIYVLCGGIQGWLFTKMSVLERLVAVVAAICLMYYDFYTDIIGILLIAILLFGQFKKSRSKKANTGEIRAII